MKIAIGFFGLIRSLKYTHESIKENLLNILENNGHQYDIYMHTYDLKILTNKRSYEKDIVLDVMDYKLLDPKEIIIDNQDNFDKLFNYKKIMQYGDAWKEAKDDFASLKNLIRQLNSLKKLTQMLDKKPKYDMYIYIRPDLKIISPFNIKWLNLKSKEIATPKYFKHRGLNDRFAIGKFEELKIYGSRIEEIFNYCNAKKTIYSNRPLHNSKQVEDNDKTRPLHSESLVKYVLNKNRIKNIDLDINLVRVRANGVEVIKDYK